MNPTPTGGSATPSPEDDEPTAEPGVVPVPAQRSGGPSLPRRTRPGGEARDGERDGDPGWDPDGRPYAAADPAALDRLLSGLRDI